MHCASLDIRIVVRAGLRALRRKDRVAASNRHSLVANEMQPNQPWSVLVAEVAENRFPGHDFQVFPIIALGEYAVTERVRVVAAFDRFVYLENDFTGFHLCSPSIEQGASVCRSWFLFTPFVVASGILIVLSMKPDCLST